MMTTTKPTVTTSKERALLIERFNRLANTVTCAPAGALSLLVAIDTLMRVVADQQQVISMLVDIVGNTEARPGD